MAQQVYGLTKRQAYYKHYQDAKKDIYDLISNEKARIQDIIDEYNREKSFIEKFNLHVNNIKYSFARGLINGGINVITAFSSIGASFLNNVSHILDDEDETDAWTDIKFLFTDLGATTIEGLTGAVVGFAADVGYGFGLNHDWAYDENTGVIPIVNQVANRARAKTLGASGGLLEFTQPEKRLANQFGDNQHSIIQSDKELLDARWNSEYVERTFMDYAMANDKDLFRENLFQGLMKIVETTTQWQEEVNKATKKAYFEQELGNSRGYQIGNAVSESIGRLVPSIVMGQFAKGTGVGAKSMALASKSYFAASIYGQSFEEAINNGASMQDAYTYAFGRMALELGSEQMFGFQLGKGIDVSSGWKILGNIMGEAAEEVIAEFGERGLGYYNNPENKIDTDESRHELWDRVMFAAIVGGISGGVFSIGGRVLSNKTDGNLRNLEQGITESVKDSGVDKTTKFLSKAIDGIQNKLNQDNNVFNQKDKAKILENPFAKQLFDVETDVNGMQTYKLNELGQKVKSGDIFAKQGNQIITMETHAVGGENYLKQYATQVIAYDIKGNPQNVQIDILTQEQLKSHKNADVAQMFLDAGWNVAFVTPKAPAMQKGANDFHAQFDPNTGITYVNINSQKGMANLISHETHDKVVHLLKNGMLTQNQAKSYQKFLNEYAKNGTKEAMVALGVKFNELAYTQAYKGRPDFATLMQAERVSAFIQQAMNNKAIIESAMNTNPGLFSKIASIFTNKLSYDKVLKEMGLDPKQNKGIVKVMNKLQKNFRDVLRANAENIKARNNLLSQFQGQTLVDNLFSLDSEMPKIKDFFMQNEIFNENGGLNVDVFISPQVMIPFMKLMIPQHNAHLYNYEVITQDTNAKLFNQGYFLNFNDMYFNKNDFVFDKSLKVVDLEFDASNNYFSFDITDSKGTKFTRFVNPQFQTKDGFIKNPVFFEASIDPIHIDYMGKVGVLPSQSFALVNVGGDNFKTKNYGPITMILKKDVINKKDFWLYNTDIFSPRREFLSNNDVILKNKFGNIKTMSPYDKMGFFYENMNHTKKVFASETIQEAYDSIHGENVETGQNYKTSDIAWEVLFINLKALRVSPMNKKMTDASIKEEINRTQNLVDVRLFDIYSQAIKSMENLAGYGVELKTVFEALNLLDQKGKSFVKVPPWVLEASKEYRSDLENINKYLDYVPYDFNFSLPEAKAEISPTDIDTIIYDEARAKEFQVKAKQNNELYGYTMEIPTIEQIKKQVMDFAEKNNIEFVETNSENSFQKNQVMQENFIQEQNDSGVVYSIDETKGKILDNNDIKELAKKVNTKKKVIQKVDPNTDIETIKADFKKLNDTENKTKEQQAIDKILKEKQNEKIDVFKDSKETIQEQFEKQDYLDLEERTDVEGSITNLTQSTLVTTLGQQKVNPYVVAMQKANVASKATYQTFERTFAKGQEARLEKLKKPKTKFDKIIADLYKSWEYYISKTKSKRKFYNHMGSHVSKTLINELSTLQNLIQGDEARVDKKPSPVELEYIAGKVNEAIFNTLDYVDSDVRIEINVSPNNPNGYAFTRGIYWFFRDMKNVQTWDDATISKFNKEKHGLAYRRLINAILNLNQKGGKQELAFAMNHFNQATNVEVVTDISLDGSDVRGNNPHTINTIKKQWQINVTNQNTIRRAIGFDAGAGSWLDMFTVGESVGLWNKNSWSMVLNEKLVRGLDRQLTIERAFKELFEKDGWLKKNYSKMVALDKTKEAIAIKSLGNVKLRKSQVIYLRDMAIRELVRNRAIDLGILYGEQTHHFDDGNQIKILAKSPYKIERREKQVIAELTNVVDLINELETIMNADSFMVEYNNKVVDYFNMMYPYVNERYKEINGMNLSNDGLAIKEGIASADPSLVAQLYEGLPNTITQHTLENMYIPFLLDNSAYFDKDKMNFKSIIDLGVFDGMTQELTDSNGKISVESVTDVLSSYSKEVSNFYGLHRIMTDLNIMWNERLDGYKQTTYIGEFISPGVVKYYTDLLNDMAGYKAPSKNPKLNRSLSWFRKNFYRASLGANFKVIGSQVTTLFNLSNMYGTRFTEMFPLMAKNFYAQHTKENRKLIKQLDKDNNVYWNRKRVSSFEMGEATTDGFAGSNKFNRAMQTLMAGIRFTDASINRALYLTLLEVKNPDTGKNYTHQEASEQVRMAILRSQSSTLALAKSPLLRTDNEVFRVMLKFLGEPMKLITQAYNSAKQMSYIRKLEAKRGDIIKQLNEAVQIEETKTKKLESDLSTQEAMENSNAFNNLTTQEQKAIRKEIKNIKKQLEAQNYVLEDVRENRDRVTKQVDEAIASKPEARRTQIRRNTAFVVAIMYLTMLRAGFELVRSKFGDKDKPEDQAFHEYLLRMLGKNYLDSLFGMFPFVRDAYQVISSGYDVDSIDEFSAFSDVGRSINYLMNALADGKDIHTGRTIRQLSVSLGRLFGVPMLQLERLFTTPLLYIDESLHYRYTKFVGRKTRDNIELKQAIEAGDTKMISTIVELKIANRNILVSNTVIDELERLTTSGYEVTMSGVNNSYTVDGVKYELTKAQKKQFAEIYNKADLVIQKIMKTSHYRRLNDDMKQSLLKAIYNYYYNMAKQIVLGVEIIPQANYFTSLNKAYAYFVKRAESFYKTQKSPKYIKEQREKQKKRA